MDLMDVDSKEEDTDPYTLAGRRKSPRQRRQKDDGAKDRGQNDEVAKD